MTGVAAEKRRQRKVEQKTYRPGNPVTDTGIRVKSCGKSARPGGAIRRDAKPRREQDQIGSRSPDLSGEKDRLSDSKGRLRVDRTSFGSVPFDTASERRPVPVPRNWKMNDYRPFTGKQNSAYGLSDFFYIL